MDQPHEEDLLDVQTEASTAPPMVLPVDPVAVVVDGPVVTVETVPQHVSTYTVVTSTDDERAVQLLPLDPLRVRATVVVHDQPVVLCHSQAQALSAGNRTPGAPSPVGAYVWAAPGAPARPLVIAGGAAVWVAPTFDQPARVTVIAERRKP